MKNASPVFNVRLFIVIITSFLSLAALANEASYLDDIWIDGTSLHGSFESNSGNTIYFPAWDPAIDPILESRKHTLAIQLDIAFDPLPFDGVKLPSIEALASVNSQNVVSEYLKFLNHFSRTSGINYLVLPDTTGLSAFEKEVINQATLVAPQFYIQKNLLNYQIPESKKNWKEHMSVSPQILIADQVDNLKKIKRWSSKYLSNEHQEFLNAISDYRNKAFTEIDYFPSDLEDRIFEEGVYAIDPDLRLPITAPAVAYLGTNEKLKNWISKYAKVYTRRTDDVPTIVDLSSNEKIRVKPTDVILTKVIVEGSTQVVFPYNIPDQEILIAKMLFGAAAIQGRHNEARQIRETGVIGFSDPVTEGLTHQFLKQLDSIGHAAIQGFATPGLQMVVAKNGSLIYEKSMGSYTYDSLKPVDLETVYDLASLTKVMATLPAIGWLLDRELIDLDDSIAMHLPEFIGSNKGKATIRQLMAHNAGLKSYVPFWSMMMDGDRLDAFYYKTPEDEAKDIRSYGFEPHPVMLDSLRSYIVKSDLIKNSNKYNYSDLGFMILHLLVERKTNQAFDQFLATEFYVPMGLDYTGFNPIASGLDVKSIAPTEFDHRFRDYLVWGEVHDRNAAVFGGVSGHAGLFSNARDLAKMMQMFLNGGYYNGRQYLSKDVLALFNKRYFNDNRRGLGWDKKDGELDASSKHASDKSFGHTGFTGTMVWADPEEDLIFVFLSNRIYPDANNNRLGKFNTRTSMHDSIYESIISESNLKLN